MGHNPPIHSGSESPMRPPRLQVPRKKSCPLKASRCLGCCRGLQASHSAYSDACLRAAKTAVKRRADEFRRCQTGTPPFDSNLVRGKEGSGRALILYNSGNHVAFGTHGTPFFLLYLYFPTKTNLVGFPKERCRKGIGGQPAGLFFLFFFNEAMCTAKPQILGCL